MQKDIALVLLCGGTGKRFSKTLPKQFHKIDNLTILEINLKTFISFSIFSYITVVSSKKYINKTKKICEKFFSDELTINITEGGSTRQLSSKNGCKNLEKYKPKKILIHDVARPFINKDLITRLIKNTKKNSGCVPVIKINDTIKDIKNNIIKSVKRDNLFLIQTPQCFNFEEICNAHMNATRNNYTDDSSLASDYGTKIITTEGLKENIKITTMKDLENCKINSNIVVGSGFDVHEFTKGKSLTLCGIQIPFSKKLKGHSDADVGIHTIVDAILGALSLGDIGDHFPPSDKKWKNANSVIFLEKCYSLIKKLNSEIVHIDITFICEEPKLTKYKLKMKKKISKILKIDTCKINIKATTTETLGFLGRKEGIAAQATVTLKK